MSRGALLLLFGMMIGGALVMLAACTPTTAPGALITSAQAVEFDTAPPEARKHRDALIRNARLSWGLDGPIALFGAQVEQESGWRVDARSPYAAGIAQFTPGTAADVSRKHSLGDADVFNVEWSLRAMTLYDRDLFDQNEYPRVCDCYGAMLSKYNGGSGWHAKRKARAPDPSDFWNSVRTVNPGITASNQAENEGYPVGIIKRQSRYLTWGASACSA